MFGFACLVTRWLRPLTREKVKARATSLKDEVVKLRAVNQQLLKRLQSQAALEAKVARLKCLLVDIRGRIEREIGSFPYQKSPNLGVNPMNLNGAYMMNACNVQCNDQLYCHHPTADGKSGEGSTLNAEEFGGCELGPLQCLAYQNSLAKELPACGAGNLGSVGNSSTTKRRKGTNAATAG